MYTVRRQLTRGNLVLLWLLPCAPAFGASVADRPALGALALLSVLGAFCGFQLLRASRRDQRRLISMTAVLSQERKARAEAEQARAHAHAVLCRLVREQAGVRDAERSRIARDIHDDLGQNLLALRIELSLMQVATNGIHPALHQKIGVMGRNLDLTIHSLRAVINNLRPLALGEGLRCAMTRQLTEFSRISGIEHQFEAADAAFAASGDAEALLYRVLQESLSNVARHAQASMVRVALQCDGAQLSLRVADNGIGMQPDAVFGCGLSGMRERADAAGGQLVIDSAPGAGMALALSLPVARTAVAS